MANMAVNGSCRWSSLPSDLIHLISTKLPDLLDRVRVRAVCKTWWSSISVSDPLPHLPWFLRYAVDRNDKILYYSLSSNKIYKIHCQQPRDTYFAGTAGGFILCCRGGWLDQSAFLFNPLNGLKISLPSYKHYSVLGVVSNPLLEDIVAVSGMEEGEGNFWMGFIRQGEEAWVIRCTKRHFNDVVCVYHEGLWYVNDQFMGDTWIEDATTREIVSIMESPTSHLVSSQHMLVACGEILLIFKCKATDEFEGISFDIFRLDKVIRGGYQWVKIRGIGDRTLFLNYIGGFSLRDNELPGFKGNCIYFMEYDLQPDSILLCRHDLENGTTEALAALPSFWGKRATWIVPNCG